MHTALISLVLMCGTCGEMQSREVVEAAPVGIVNPVAPPCSITVSYPPVSMPYGCPGCGCGSKSDLPPAYGCCPDYARAGCTTLPAWLTNYHPAWYLYPNHRMFLDPADYAQPYPYRERFNYPGHDPRCQCAMPPIGY